MTNSTTIKDLIQKLKAAGNDNVSNWTSHNSQINDSIYIHTNYLFPDKVYALGVYILSNNDELIITDEGAVHKYVKKLGCKLGSYLLNHHQVDVIEYEPMLEPNNHITIRIPTASRPEEIMKAEYSLAFYMQKLTFYTMGRGVD